MKSKLQGIAPPLFRVSSIDNFQNQVREYNSDKDIEFFDKDEYTEYLLNDSNFTALLPKLS